VCAPVCLIYIHSCLNSPILGLLRHFLGNGVVYYVTLAQCDLKMDLGFLTTGVSKDNGVMACLNSLLTIYCSTHSKSATA